MSLLFVDSFDHYSAADVAMKWDLVTGQSLIASTGRRGTQGFRSDSVDSLQKMLAAASGWVLGVAFRTEGIVSSPLFGVRDANTPQVAVEMVSTGALVVRRGGGTILGSSTLALLPGVYYYLELKTVIANTSGVAILRVNGSTVLSLTDVDTQNTANATANQVMLGVSAATAVTFDYDDFYCCDTEGAECHDFLGDIRVEVVRPRLSGTISAFSPSSAGATGVSMISETTPNSNTNYLRSSAVSAQQRLLFSGVSVLSSLSVYGVQACWNLARSDTGSAKSAAAIVLVSGSSAQGASLALAVSYGYLLGMFQSHVGTGASWAVSTIDAAEWGVQTLT